MNLESVTAALRPRSAWEAADFGVRLIRRDAAAIYRIWFAITLPLLAIGMLVIWLTPWSVAGALVYWWLEPVVDGPILHVISRRLFGDTADARAAVRAAPGLAWRNRIFLLPPYRFHIARSIAMPLTQLEGLRGRARRNRAAVINRRIFNYGTGLTMAYQHLVISLYLGVILTAYALIPIEYQGTIGSDVLSILGTDGSRTAATITLLISFCAQTALQPWFVGAGFGLYVNCRTQLEAWDLEVAFRRIVQRRERKATQMARAAANAARPVAGAATLAALVCCALLHPDPAAAQKFEIEKNKAPEADASGLVGYWSDDEVRPAVDAVMASDALRMTRESEVWRRIDQEDQKDEPNGPTTGLARILEPFARILSGVFEFGLWFLAGALIVWLGFHARRWLSVLAPVPAAAPASGRTVVLASDAIDNETLPADIPGEALRAFEAGDARTALSLLYRGSVHAAVDRHGLRLPESATERMCLDAVRAQTGAGFSAWFGRLVAAWVACAYAARTPDRDLVARLCAEWRSLLAPES